MSDSNRLKSIDWVIIVLTFATGLIHLTLGVTQLGQDDSFLPIAFILNSVTYIGLVIGIYFIGALRPYQRTLKWLLAALAAVTIVLYFVFNGAGGLSSPIGLVTKAIEVALIVAIFISNRR